MAIVTDGLIAYWNGLQGLVDSRGVIHWNNIAPATSGSGLYNATLTNGAVADSVGGLVSFDGVDDHVSIPTINMNNSTGQEITVELIVSFTAMPTQPIPISLYNPASTGRFIYASVLANPNKLVNQFQSSALSDFRGVDIISTNTVYSLTLSLNRVSNTFNNYLNGVKSSLTIDPATVFSEIQYGATLGGFYNGGAYSNFFQGKIYAVRIYNRALTDAEVIQNYNNGTAVGLASSVTQLVSGSSNGIASTTASPIETQLVSGVSNGTASTTTAQLVSGLSNGTASITAASTQVVTGTVGSIANTTANPLLTQSSIGLISASANMAGSLSYIYNILSTSSDGISSVAGSVTNQAIGGTVTGTTSITSNPVIQSIASGSSQGIASVNGYAIVKTVLVSDSFNRADSIPLGTTDNYSGGTARTWQYSGIAFGISGNRAYSTATNSGQNAFVDIGVSDNISVSADVTWNPSNMAVVIRYTDLDNRIYAFMDSNLLGLYKYVAGSPSAIPNGSYAMTPVSGNTYNLKITAKGTALTVTLDGLDVIATTDSSNLSGTKVGLYGTPNGYFDNFIVNSEGTIINASSGSSDGIASTTASLTGIQLASGTVNGISNVTANCLLTQLSIGSISASSNTAGSLSYIYNILSQSNGIDSTSATPTIKNLCSGSSNGISGVAGLVVSIQAVNVGGSTGIIASPVLTQSALGSTSGAGNVTSTPSFLSQISTMATGVSSVSNTSNVIQTSNSTISGLTSVSSNAVQTKAVIGSSSGLSSASATLAGVQAINGTIDGVSNASALISVIINATTTSDGSSSVVSNVNYKSFSSGSSIGSTNTNAVSKEIISGAIAGTSSLSGNPSIGSFLNSDGTSSVASNIIYKSLSNSGSSDGSSSASANAINKQSVVGQSDNASSVTAFVLTIKLASDSVATGQSNIILSTPVRIQNSAQTASGSTTINSTPVFIRLASAIINGSAYLGEANPLQFIGNMYGFANGRSIVIGNPSNGKPAINTIYLNGELTRYINLQGSKRDKEILKGTKRGTEILKGSSH